MPPERGPDPACRRFQAYNSISDFWECGLAGGPLANVCKLTCSYPIWGASVGQIYTLRVQDAFWVLCSSHNLLCMFWMCVFYWSNPGPDLGWSKLGYGSDTYRIGPPYPVYIRLPSVIMSGGLGFHALLKPSDRRCVPGTTARCRHAARIERMCDTEEGRYASIPEFFEDWNQALSAVTCRCS